MDQIPELIDPETLEIWIQKHKTSLAESNEEDPEEDVPSPTTRSRNSIKQSLIRMSQMAQHLSKIPLTSPSCRLKELSRLHQSDSLFPFTTYSLLRSLAAVAADHQKFIEALSVVDEPLRILTEANEGLACKVSFHYRYIFSRNDFPVVLAEARQALLRAILAFDLSRGCQFSTYASASIRRYLNLHLGELLRFFPLDHRGASKLNRLSEASNQWIARTGRLPTMGELAKETNFSESRIKNLKILERQLHRPRSLSSPSGSTMRDAGSVRLLQDRIPDRQTTTPYDERERSEFRNLLQRAFNGANLTTKERTALSLTYEMSESSDSASATTGREEALAVLGLTPEQLKSVLLNGIKKLRAYFKAHYIGNPLDESGFFRPKRGFSSCSHELETEV